MKLHKEHTKIPNIERQFGLFFSFLFFFHQALIIGSLHIFMMTYLMIECTMLV